MFHSNHYLCSFTSYSSTHSLYHVTLSYHHGNMYMYMLLSIYSSFIGHFWQFTRHPLHILSVLLALLTSYTNNPSLVSTYEKLVHYKLDYMILFHFFLLGHHLLQIYWIKLIDTWLNSRQWIQLHLILPLLLLVLEILRDKYKH